MKHLFKEVKNSFGLSKVVVASLAILTLTVSLQACSSSDDDGADSIVGSDNVGSDNDSSGNSSGSSAGNLTSNSEAVISNQNDTAVPANLPAASRSLIFDYSMPSVVGGSTTARAQLFIPNNAAPDNGYSLVVWAHGTTGISNACTPSASFENFGNSIAVDALLDAGYAVLAPDYEGFGTDQIHPYYIRSSHAASVIHAVIAAHQLDDQSLSSDWAVVGHSQGGHVALATARAADLSDYPLQAVVALAPGTDLQAFSERAFDAIDTQVANGDINNAIDRLFFMNAYAAYVANAVTLVSNDFDPQSIFGESVAPLIEQSIEEEICGQYTNSLRDALQQHFVAGGTVTNFQGLVRTWYEVPGIADRLDQEELGDESQPAPLLIVQGDADRQVPIEATTAFVERQRSIGTDVTYEQIAGGRHGDVARAEFGRTIAWLTNRFPAN